MFGTIFAETLRRGWKSALGWGIGIASFAWLNIIIAQDSTMLTQMASLMETLPTFLLQMFGTTDIQFMATPDGYLAFRMFSFILMIFVFYSAVAGLNVTANDEDAGIMDEFLSLPVVRWQLVLAKLIAFAILSAFVVGLMAAGLFIGFAMTPNVAFNIERQTLATVNILPSMLVVLTFTVMVATIMRRKGAAIALAAVFIIGSYVLDVLGSTAPDTILGTLRQLSFFAYYDSTGVIQNGLSVVNVGVLLAASTIFAVIAMWRYQQRDIGL